MARPPPQLRPTGRTGPGHRLRRRDPPHPRPLEDFDVTGLDISARPIELARRNVPTACFIHGDVTGLAFPPASSDAAVASYSLFHLPRAEDRTLFRSVARWLRPGGVLLANFGVGNREVDYDEDWLRGPLFWSSFDADGERAALSAARFELALDCVETVMEDGRPHRFLLVVARNPRGAMTVTPDR